MQKIPDGKDTNVPSKTLEEIKKGLNVLYPPSYQTTYSEYVEAIACIPDAIYLIEQLESHSPKWTSVAEHLPQKPGKYLVYSKVGTMYTSKFDPDIHKRWPHFGKVGVTHWMPRPEEPKEEEA